MEKIFTYHIGLDDISSRELERLALYYIADARSRSLSLYQFELHAVDSVQLNGAIAKLARLFHRLKKEGKLSVFVRADELGGGSTEAEYLINRFPYLSDQVDQDAPGRVLMLN